MKSSRLGRRGFLTALATTAAGMSQSGKPAAADKVSAAPASAEQMG